MSLHDMVPPSLPTPTDHADVLPPAEPPPTETLVGSLMDHILTDPSRQRSPSTPFEFPFPLESSPHIMSPPTHGRSVLRPVALPDFPSVMDSVTRVIGSPRVFGLRHDSSSYVRVRKTSTSLLDAGANICLTGDLQLLVDVVEIPPLPISVAITGNAPSLDDCCTRRGYLPLLLSDGSTHWQLQSYLHRPSLNQALSLLLGHKRDSRTVAPARFNSTAKRDYSPCVWT